MSRLPTLDGDDEEKKESSRNKSPGLPSMDDMPSIDNMPSMDDMPGFENMPPINDSDDDDFESLSDDDDFESLSEDDEFEELDEGEIYEEPEEIKGEDPKPKEKPEASYATEEDYNPDFEEDLKGLEKNKFIDKKKKKLIPFGGKKSKRSKIFVKSSDFDDRNNKLAKTKIIQFGIILALILLFLLGLKNTFMPSHVYSGDQIRQFASEGAGNTGFPEERGKAYVESFMDSYLTLDRTKPELIQVLSHFYGEKMFKNTDSTKLNMRWGSDAKQHVIISPKVFEVELFTEYSAQYKISAYVSNTDGEEISGENPVGRWLSFSINVYYDIDKDSMIITPDSPSIIPSYRITDQTMVPERAPFGNGQVNKDIVPSVTPTINGFIEAYAKSSVDSHESILQYIDDKDDIKLYDGFGGAVQLNGNPADAIKKMVYNNDDGVYRADLTVQWVDVAASQEDNQVEYTARYIMRIKPSADGKFTVSSFVPYTYYKK